MFREPWAILMAPSVYLAGLAACSGPPARPEPAPVVAPVAPAPAPRRPIATPRLVAGPSAFDLVATADGAAFFWGSPPQQGAEVGYLPLSPYGEVVGRAGVVPAPHTDGESVEMVRELVADSSSGTTFVAWITRGVRHRIFWTFARTSLREPRSLARATQLTMTTELPTLARGNIGLHTTESDTATLFARLADQPCSAGEGSCTAIQRTSLFADGRAETDPASQLLLAHSCDSPIVGVQYNVHTLFFALSCGGPSTTLYSIRRDVPYASALPLAAGCSPRALLASSQGATLHAQCEGRQVWTEVTNMGAAAPSVSANATAKCELAGPVLRVRGDGREISLPLRTGRSGLAGWLPESIAPNGARAVWTGAALLVALPQGRDIAFQRFECRDGELERTDF